MTNAKLGTKAVGSIVKLKVNGTAKEFIVVHQGKPSSIYDESCNGTWLLMKDIYENIQWNSPDVNVLETSAIHRYLNSTFLGLFDSDIQGFIKQVKIPYRKGGGSNGTTQQGENGLPCKIFLLSAPEVHYENMFIYSGEGAALSYFASCATNTSDSKRIAYLNGSATAWWLRSPTVSYIESAWLVYPNGNCNIVSVSNSYGIRPTLVLPPDMEVDSSGNVTPPPPATHKTLVNGTVYEVQGGKCLVNGTVYSIKKGRTLIGGTGYDVLLGNGSPKLTWVINESFSLPPTSPGYKANFVSNNTSYVRLQALGNRLAYYYLISNGAAESLQIAYNGYSWLNENYRTITFDTEPTGDLLTWLQANATPQ